MRCAFGLLWSATQRQTNRERHTDTLAEGTGYGTGLINCGISAPLSFPYPSFWGQVRDFTGQRFNQRPQRWCSVD
jgi:hypothetical protein